MKISKPMESIYSVDSYHHNSPRLAAQAFAREYWKLPRKIKNFMLSPMTEHHSGRIEATFNIIGGTGRVYVVKYQPENVGVTSARWVIEVVE